MRTLALPLLVLLYFHGAFAQNASPIIVKAGTSIKESVSPEDLYMYPQFRYGKVVYKDGKRSGGKMNYSKLFDEMLFINPFGDTLAIANERTVSLISIDADTFYYDKGYVKYLTTIGNTKLAVKPSLKVADKVTIGGYDMANPASAITSYKTYDDGVRSYNLTVREDLVLVRVEQYYLGDKYNHFVLANKKNVFDFFSKHEEAVKRYLYENKVDFNSHEDVEKLLLFLASL
jgi:hypothetical protein